MGPPGISTRHELFTFVTGAFTSERCLIVIMRQRIWLWSLSSTLLLIGTLLAAPLFYFRIKPLPTSAEIHNAARQGHAERLRDLPSLKDLPEMEPVRIEQALILEPINGLPPGKPERAKRWHPKDDPSTYPPETDFRVEYLSKDSQAVVIVQVDQFPNDSWPQYFAKWSPSPGLLKDENPSLVLTRMTKFKNQIVMDRQFRFPDESGHLWFFWPSG